MIIPKIIVNTCKGREQFVEYLKERIPDLIVNFDDFTDTGKFKSTAFFNYQRGWKLAGSDATVHLDDDILLCNNFTKKINEVISQRPNDVIQFFSMRKKDLEIGSRYENGANFMMQQCYYLPKGMSESIYNFSNEYYNKTNDKYCPSDGCMAEFFKRNKVKYWIHIPNLVDHRVAKSMIGNRSSKRQSKTFKL